jgi:transcriptional regulator with XRE-family HTH domain
MKKTEEDRLFASRFAEVLQPFVSRDRDNGKSLAEIAAELGVTAAGLQKQLAGGTPSIRTIVRAYKKYGVSVPYEDTEIAKAVSSKGRRRNGQAIERQFLLPFDIIAPAFSKALVLKRIPQGVRRYRLQLTVGMSR